MIKGILLGLGAALFQSLAYLSSRYFTDRKGGTPIQLLLTAHLMMGIAAGAVLLSLDRESFPPLGEYILPVLGTTFAFLTGQFILMAALNLAAASRISPLTGLKLLFIVIITTVLFAVPYTALQISAVFIALAGAVILNYAGGRMSSKALLLGLTATLLLAISDIYIQVAVGHFSQFSLIMRGLIPLVFSYLIAGGVSLLLYPFFCPLNLKTVGNALPYSLFWSAGILLYFMTVGQVGVMYATILQSTRGLLNVVFGATLGWMGYHLLEEKHGWKVIVRRISAALMMTGAVALFGFGGNG